jgi:hypothetical protein
MAMTASSSCKKSVNAKAAGGMPLRLYPIYGPLEHIDGTIHWTCTEANDADEHFAGRAPNSET